MCDFSVKIRLLIQTSDNSAYFMGQGVSQLHTLLKNI
jgi:hypothetical protein